MGVRASMGAGGVRFHLSGCALRLNSVTIGHSTDREAGCLLAPSLPPQASLASAMRTLDRRLKEFAHDDEAGDSA